MTLTVSVIIPTYNRSNYVQQAVESVLNQTYNDYEILVIDDGSTDDTKRLLEKYADRIKYVYQTNQKVGAARNNGIRHAQGKYIAFLDSDDLWLPQKLERDVAYFEANPQVGLVYSNVIYFSDEGANLYTRRMKSPSGDVLEKIIIDNFVVTSTVVVKRECLDRVGLFNEDLDLASSEDWEMWVRVASQYPLGYISEASTKSRIHHSKLMGNPEGMERSILRGLEIIWTNENLLPRISHLKNRSYASLYTYIAINYYASGQMAKAREYLKEAVGIHPPQLFDRKFVYTFLRSLLGRKVSQFLRKQKYLIKRNRE